MHTQKKKDTKEHQKLEVYLLSRNFYSHRLNKFLRYSREIITEHCIQTLLKMAYYIYLRTRKRIR